MLTFGNRRVRRLQVGLPLFANRRRRAVRGVPAADRFQPHIGRQGASDSHDFGKYDFMDV